MIGAAKRAAASMALVWGQGAGAAPLDIVFFAEGATERNAAALDQAEAFWERIVTGYQDGADIGGPLEIDVFVVDEDGPGGTLATGGWDDAVVTEAGFILPVLGSIRFDSADLPMPNTPDEQLAFETLLHEVGHALGFGTLWDANGLRDGDAYIGTAGVEAYVAEFGLRSADGIPLATGEGEGEGGDDADGDYGHWDEDWPGGPAEMMTPFQEGTASLSATTIASFRDLGYTTVEPAARGSLPVFSAPAPAPIPLPATAWLLGGALIGTFVWRRRPAD